MYICMYIYIYMITKFQIEHWDRNSTGEVYRPREGFSRLAQTFLPAIGIFRMFPSVCWGL